MSADLERAVIEIFARQLERDPATLSRATTFKQLDINSLAVLELLFALEETFGIAIPDEAAQAMESVGQVVDGLRALGVTPPAPAT